MRETTTKIRLARMLAEDKDEMNSETEEAAIRDFKRVANEYFETDGKLKLTIKQEKGESAVTVSFRALRVKNFTALR